MKTKTKVNFIKNVFSRDFHTLVFFVTSVCNANCPGCFNWKNLNQKNNLTLEEIEKISKGMPKFSHILFSGGEPSLREDLPEICKIFVKNNYIKSISIPTNGFLPGVISKLVKDVMDKNSALEVGVHFSVDGFKPIHETLRGTKNIFEKVMESIEQIKELKKNYPQLYVSINSVVSNKNYEELGKFSEFVKTLKVDSHTFDYLRGSIKENKVELPPIKDLEKFNKLRKSLHKYYLKDQGLLHKVFSTLKENYLIKIQMDILKNKRRDSVCLSGQVAGVLYHDGNVALCEKRGCVGNVRKEGYSFSKVWSNKISNKQRKAIKNKECFCTNICFRSMSLDHLPLSIFIKMPLNFLFRK